MTLHAIHEEHSSKFAALQEAFRELCVDAGVPPDAWPFDNHPDTGRYNWAEWMMRKPELAVIGTAACTVHVKAGADGQRCYWQLFDGPDGEWRRTRAPELEQAWRSCPLYMPIPGSIEGKRRRTTLAAEVWDTRTLGITVETEVFAPDCPDDVFVKDMEGRPAINTYAMVREWRRESEIQAAAEWSQEDKQRFHELLGLFFEQQIAPNPDERKWLLARLANKLKHPAMPGVGTLLTTPSYGVGRGVLFDLLAKAIGHRYCAFLPQEAVQQVSGFWAYGPETLVAIVEEMSERVLSTVAAQAQYEHFKQLIDPRPAIKEINRKYATPRREAVFASWFMSSNNAVPLALRRHDRRLAVISNGRTPLDKRPWKRELIGYATREGAGKLFADYVLQFYDPELDVTEPPDTEAKNELVDASEGEILHWLREQLPKVFAEIEAQQAEKDPEIAKQLRGAFNGMSTADILVKLAYKERRAEASGKSANLSPAAVAAVDTPLKMFRHLRSACQDVPELGVFAGKRQPAKCDDGSKAQVHIFAPDEAALINAEALTQREKLRFLLP